MRRSIGGGAQSSKYGSRRLRPAVRKQNTFCPYTSLFILDKFCSVYLEISLYNISATLG